MAGLGEYGDEGFSSYHSKKNPFLIAQAVSSNPVNMENSPMKDFGLISGPIAAAVAAAAKAAAATKVGAAVVGAAKAVGAKLAATKVGGAVVKGVSAVSKGVKAVKGAVKASKIGKTIGKVSKGIKKFTGKLTPKIGGKVGETAATEATKTGVEQATKEVTKTGIEGATKAGTEGAIKTSSKGGFDATQVSTSKPVVPKPTGSETTTATTTTPKAPSTDAVKVPEKKSWLDEQLSTENIGRKVHGNLQSADAEKEQKGKEGYARASQHITSMKGPGELESHVDNPTANEELGSVLTFKRAMPKPIPLRLRTKRALSPFRAADPDVEGAKGWGSTQVKAMKGDAQEIGKTKSKVKDSLNSMSVFGDK
tara:strand:- start:40 stop:1137 length:1098 start_codon:yes stop_codon:yes gene_type:complete